MLFLFQWREPEGLVACYVAAEDLVEACHLVISTYKLDRDCKLRIVEYPSGVCPMRECSDFGPEPATVKLSVSLLSEILDTIRPVS